MELLVKKSGDVAVVTLPIEELDAANAADFKAVMAPLFEQNANLVLNLSRLRFVDSSGLGALLSCLRMAISNGHNLRLCELSTQVRALFELVRMHRVFDIYHSEDDALSA